METTHRTASLPAQADIIDAGLIRRPVRTPLQGAVAMATSREAVLTALIGCAIVLLLFPALWLFLLPGMLGFHIAVTSRKYRLPFKVPKAWGGPDYGAPKPGGRGYGNAAGILYFGQDMVSGEQLWIENGDARRHGFFLGTTGSGKALPVDTPVLTPEGWVRNGDLRPGDPVIHADGTPAKILSVHPQRRIPAARLWFEDGRTAVCSLDHLWQVRIEPASGSAMPAGLETRDEVRRAGDIGILIGMHGDAIRVSVPLAAPFEGPEGPDTDGLDAEAARRAARDGLAALGWSPALRGRPQRRLAFLKAWIAETGTRVTASGQGIRLFGVAPRDAKILKQIAWSLGGTASDILPARPRPDGSVDVVMRMAGAPEIHPGAGRGPERLAIVRVDRLDEDLPMSCIRIDREDGLFVMEGHLVTHNTELLLGVVSQTLMWSSGFLFIDGKGTTEFYARAWTLCRRFGREDDIRVLNFTDAGGDPDAPAGGPDTQSNTINPFAKGSADQLMNIVVSLMGDAGSGNDMWKNRAMSLVTAEMKALCELRDAGEILLNVQTVRDFLTLGRGIDRQFVRRRISGIEDVPEQAWDEMRTRAGMIELYLRAMRREFSEATYLALKGFFDTLPGFSLERALNGEPQDQKCLEQYGFLSMQLTKPLGSLADDYGHIFRTPLGEVDIDDVVLNRRILVVLLPALQKAPEEMQNCGKIVVTLCKIMMGNASGFMLQGSRQEIVEAKQTRAPSPFIVVLDEAGYYMVPGIDVMMAQARSLGFMIIVAGQDMAAMQKTSPQIAETAAANASIFAAGKTVDGDKTVRFIQAIFGRTQVAVSSGFTRQEGLVSSRLVDRMDVSFQEVEKVKVDELQNMMEGEFYFLFNGTLVKAATFYIGGDFASEFAVNKFLKVRGPTDRVPGLDQSREIAFMRSWLAAGKVLAAAAAGNGLPWQDEASREDALSRVVAGARKRLCDGGGGSSPLPDPLTLHKAWRDALAEVERKEDAVEDMESGENAEIEDFMVDGDQKPFVLDPDVESFLEEDIFREDERDGPPVGPSAGISRGTGRPRSGEPESRVARGLRRIVTAHGSAERHAGMIDILVAQEEARARIRRQPEIDRCVREAEERIAMEVAGRAQSVRDLCGQILENTDSLRQIFSGSQVDALSGIDLLRKSGSRAPIDLHPGMDEAQMNRALEALESIFAQAQETVS